MIFKYTTEAERHVVPLDMQHSTYVPTSGLFGIDIFERLLVFVL